MLGQDQDNVGGGYDRFVGSLIIVISDNPNLVLTCHSGDSHSLGSYLSSTFGMPLWKTFMLKTWQSADQMLGGISLLGKKKCLHWERSILRWFLK